MWPSPPSRSERAAIEWGRVWPEVWARPVSTAAEAEAAWLVLRRLQGSNGVEMSTALARRARGG